MHPSREPRLESIQRSMLCCKTNRRDEDMPKCVLKAARKHTHLPCRQRTIPFSKSQIHIYTLKFLSSININLYISRVPHSTSSEQNTRMKSSRVSIYPSIIFALAFFSPNTRHGRQAIHKREAERKEKKRTVEAQVLTFSSRRPTESLLEPSTISSHDP